MLLIRNTFIYSVLFIGLGNRKQLSIEYIPDTERERKEELCW